MLQIFDGFDAVGQGSFETSQWFTRQRGASFGGVALPGHGVGYVDAGCIAQSNAFFSPGQGQSFLFAVAAFFFNTVAQDFGGTFVTVAHFFEDVLQG